MTSKLFLLAVMLVSATSLSAAAPPNSAQAFSKAHDGWEPKDLSRAQQNQLDVRHPFPILTAAVIERIAARSMPNTGRVHCAALETRGQSGRTRCVGER